MVKSMLEATVGRLQEPGILFQVGAFADNHAADGLVTERAEKIRIVEIRFGKVKVERRSVSLNKTSFRAVTECHYVETSFGKKSFWHGIFYTSLKPEYKNLLFGVPFQGHIISFSLHICTGVVK